MACPQPEIEDLAQQFGRDDAGATVRLERLMEQYPDDPQLLFLKGSILAGQGLTSEGRTCMMQAVELAPTYDIARFQLGFLELTSGDPVAAQQSWAPFHTYPNTHFLRLFVEGLGCLIRDEFPQCIALLNQGMAANDVIPQMNHDIQLILSQLDTTVEPQLETSASHLLLQQYNVGDTRH